MIVKKMNEILSAFKTRLDKIEEQAKDAGMQQAELQWSNIFHDTIKDREWLHKLSISPGGWSVNYSFLYVLVRILNDYKPETILELGLGESSKIISRFIENLLPGTSHIILEQSEDWVNDFQNRFQFTGQSEIKLLPQVIKSVKGYDVKSYEGIEKKINKGFNLYLVDGPHGSERFSRYDILGLASKLSVGDDFIIIIDDYARQGEKDTVADLLDWFKSNSINVYTGTYAGNKTQMVITSEKFRLATSL